MTRVQLRARLMADAKSSNDVKRAEAIRMLKFTKEKGVLMALRSEPEPLRRNGPKRIFRGQANSKATAESVPESPKASEQRHPVARRRQRGAAVRAGISFAIAVASCAPPPATAEAPQAVAPVVVSHVTLPTGVLEQACTPTGPELCFNAVDDNCNGVIDEGCGEETGVLQFAIAWGDNPADVNVMLETPDHVRVEKPQSQPVSAAECSRDRDCPSAVSCRGQNVENIHCDAPEPAARPLCSRDRARASEWR